MAEEQKDPKSTPLAALLERVHFGTKTVFDLAEGGKSLTVEARRLLPEEPRPPVREESPRRMHEFLSAKSFADYLARYGEKDEGSHGTVVFVDPVNEVIFAVLDECAEEGFEVVTMKPAVHPLWAPWVDEVIDQEIEAKEFAAFVARNRRVVSEPDGRELALELAQIRASVSIDAQVGRGKNAVNGLKVTTKVQGESQFDLVELPDTLVLEVPLYVDTPKRKVEVDLCIESNAGGQVTVLASGGTIAEAKVAAFEEMVATIREGLKDLGATITFGRPKTEKWAYLPELKPAS